MVTSPMTTAQKIAAAEKALQSLLTGSMVEELQRDNIRTRFFPTDVEKLRGYIADLKAEDSGVSRRGAIGVRF